MDIKGKTSLIVLMLLFAGLIIYTQTLVVNADYSNLVEIVPMEHAYIKSDGTIDPPSLPIERKDNFYLLKGNIVN